MLTMDDDDVGKAHFNLDDLLIDKSNKKSKKNKKKFKDAEEGASKEDDFKVNLKNF